MRLIERLLRFVLLVATIVCVSGSNLSGQPAVAEPISLTTRYDVEVNVIHDLPGDAPVVLENVVAGCPSDLADSPCQLGHQRHHATEDGLRDVRQAGIMGFGNEQQVSFR